MPDQRPWSISELNGAIKDLLENSLMPMWVEGEVGNLTIHRSGHVYLTLKDASSQIRAVYFSGAALCRKMNLREGDKIEAYGKVTVYGPRGEYQLSVSRLHLCGLGDLQRQFEEMKNRLAAAGFFDPAHKKPIPALPRRIGVISSPSGAALKDFLKIALARFPNLQIKVCPAAVQGKGAEIKLARAIRYFNKIGGIDVIVLTRGGGSLEDLWPFNDEILARAIYESKIPVVSAVGHEIDFTIADFVADSRAPTPSGAAEQLVPQKQVFHDTLASFDNRIRSALDLCVQKSENRLTRTLSSKVFQDSAGMVMERMQTIDYCIHDAETILLKRIDEAEHRLNRAMDAMNAYSPESVLKRGFAFLLDEKTGQPLPKVQGIRKGQKVLAVLSDGKLGMNVESISR